MVNRPSIKNFTVSLSFPKYLNRAPENLENIGSFQAPMGTEAKWIIRTSDVQEIAFKFHSDNDVFSPDLIDNQLFEYKSSLFYTDDYSINLQNKFSQNKEAIQYKIEVIEMNHLEDFQLIYL